MAIYNEYNFGWGFARFIEGEDLDTDGRLVPNRTVPAFATVPSEPFTSFSIVRRRKRFHSH